MRVSRRKLGLHITTLPILVFFCNLVRVLRAASGPVNAGGEPLRREETAAERRAAAWGAEGEVGGTGSDRSRSSGGGGGGGRAEN